MSQATNRRIIVSFGLLAAILVAAGFMAVQFAPRTAAPAVAVSPSPVAAASLAADYGPPPPSVPLVWVQDPNHPGWLIGFDWTGTPRGTVKISQTIGQYDRLRQAPDGSAFGIEPNGKGGAGVFLDRLGSPLPNQDSTVRYQDETWADDNLHLCTLDSTGGLDSQWRIGLKVPGAAPNPLSVVALDSPNLRSGIIAISFAACSARNDRAVLAYSYMSRPTEFWVVRISDGAILSHRTYAAGELVNVSASSDASLIAENSGKSLGQVAAVPASTVILRAADMSVITTLDPNIGVVAFSGDNSAVLVTAGPWVAGQPAMQEVLDLQTGRVIWSGEGTAALGAFMAQPAGHAFAVALTQPGEGSGPATILMLYGDGSKPAKLPGLFVPTW